jgi:hypothetical protein
MSHRRAFYWLFCCAIGCLSADVARKWWRSHVTAVPLPVLLAVAGTLVFGWLMTRSAPNVASPDQHVVLADQPAAKPATKPDYAVIRFAGLTLISL